MELLPDEEARDWTGTQPDEALESERREAKEVLFGLVNALPDKLRIAVMLHFGSGFSQTEIAQMTGCRQSTISERMNEALEKLRQGLSRVGYSGFPAALPVLLGDTLTSPPASCLPAALPESLWRIGKEVSRRLSAKALAAKGAGSTAKAVMVAAAVGLAGTVAVLSYTRTPQPAPALSAEQRAEHAPAPLLAEKKSESAPAEKRLSAAVLPLELPAWKPFTDEYLTVYPKNKGLFKPEQHAEGMSVTFTPLGGKPQAFISYGYLGHNFTASCELTGILEYLGDEEQFACHVGICLPNRLNFGSMAWSPEKSNAPLEFRIQVWFDEAGCRFIARMRDAQGKIYGTKLDDFVNKPPWVDAKGEKILSDKPSKPGWRQYEGMQECGFAFAFTDKVRISKLRFRPLVKEAELPVGQPVK